MLSREVENYLFGGEEVALVVRRHPVVLVKPSLAPLAGLVLFAAVPNTFTFALFFVVGVRFAWDFGLWWLDRYILTTNRILSLSGIVSKAVISMPLAKITDLTYTRSLAGRLLGYGKLHLESAGQVGLESIDFLPDPDHVYRSVMSLALGPPSEDPDLSVDLREHGHHVEVDRYDEQRRQVEPEVGRHHRDDIEDHSDGDEPHHHGRYDEQHRTSEIPLIRRSDD